MKIAFRLFFYFKVFHFFSCVLGREAYVYIRCGKYIYE